MSWLSAIGSVAGGLFGNASSARQASKQRAWEEQMYKNRYQYQAEDMDKAGLNRILSATGQNAGSVPSGAVASQSNPFDGAGETYASVSNAKTARKQAEANISLAGSQEKVNMSQTNLNNVQAMQTSTLTPLQALQLKASITDTLSQIDTRAMRIEIDKSTLKLAERKQVNDDLRVVADCSARYAEVGYLNASAQERLTASMKNLSEKGLLDKKTISEVSNGLRLSYEADIAQSEARRQSAKTAIYGDRDNSNSISHWLGNEYGAIAELLSKGRR